MATASEIQEVLPGLTTWQAFCFSAKVELTSHAVSVGGKIYLVDPIRLTKAGLVQLETLPGKISAIFLTNGNHERDAAFYRDRYDIPIQADPAAATEFSCSTRPFESDDAMTFVSLPGAGLGEIGIYVPAEKWLLLGDIIINLDSFAFAPLPDKYATDPKQMRHSLRSLTRLEIRLIAFAHGLPVTEQAAARLAALLA